ncbi:MAG TPA: hypothetical protein VMC41_04475 [Candidatus Nanoarchaeia archaeon]|nr:hypothetical protein [Candidatus Nanoarchaeia archaeon]
MATAIITWSVVSIVIIIILSCYLFPTAIRINKAKKGVIIHLSAEDKAGKIIFDKKIMFLIYRYPCIADIAKFLVVTNDEQCPSHSFAFIPGLVAITVATTTTIPGAIEIREHADRRNFMEPMTPIRFEGKNLLKIR